MRPRLARSSIAVVRARRDVFSVHDHCPGGGREVGWRGRDVDRRRVEVDRVLAEPPPVEEAPANQAREDQRRTNQADDGIELPAALEPCGGFGRGHLVDAVHGGEDRRVPVVCAQVREHVVLEDLLAFAVGQERGGETGRRVELDLSARTARLEVEEDREAVVEPLAADAPLVDQRLGLPLGLLGGGVATTCV